MNEPASELELDAIDGGLALWIHVTPRARHPKVGGLHDNALRVAVAAAPVEGRANAACVDALARALDCRKADVAIDPASKGRRKRVRLTGDPETLRERLCALAAPSRLG